MHSDNITEHFVWFVYNIAIVELKSVCLYIYRCMDKLETSW